MRLVNNFILVRLEVETERELGIFIGVFVIVILEIGRYLLMINNSFKYISEIKEKVINIEELLKNQSK